MQGSVFTLSAIAALAVFVPATADELSEMTDKINRAAGVMGEPHDAVSADPSNPIPGLGITQNSDCSVGNPTPDNLPTLESEVGPADPQAAENMMAAATLPPTVLCLTGTELTGKSE